jgi:ABC-2 type transport system permease protein
MKALLLRELSPFLLPIGYLVIAIPDYQRVIPLGFEGDYNILNTGFADMSPFFTLAPWILIFLIPAITMRSFADEKTGTLELLLTKPLSLWQIVNGKFLGATDCTGHYSNIHLCEVISNLAMPEGNIDMGSTIGSYAGLMLLMVRILLSDFHVNPIR